MNPEEVLSAFIASHWWEVISSIVTIAGMIAALTPNKYDNLAAKVLRAIIDALALNFGGAKNKPGNPGLAEKLKFWKKEEKPNADQA